MSDSVPLDHRSANALWASVLVETLVRAGVRRAVLSPGSRSTPLTIAFARHPGIVATPVLDERSAAFFALGAAKATGVPVVLVCTSGTAAANYFPAIVEAHESAVPLIVITADRPPEMRACASGQTIDQLKLYGGYVQFFHELAVPELGLGRFRYLRQTVLHAVDRALAPTAGPVHLNAPFRDPLPPLPDGGVAEQFARSIDWAKFFARVDPSTRAAGTLTAAVAAASALPQFSPECHGLIVVGPNQPADPEAFAIAVGGLAKRLGWPVLADALSPLRHFASRVPHLVTTYDIILRNPAAAERLAPEIVLGVGEWPTSKVLRAWLEQHDAVTWLATERLDNRDALHGRTRPLPAPLATWLAGPEANAPGGYARMWLRYAERVRPALAQRLAAEVAFVEPKVVAVLAAQLAPGTPLFVANSMPIRDLEYFWPPSDRGVRPFCNRGANGIDGTLSSALGVAAGLGRPTVLLTGDLALLHDTNGFLLAPKLQGSLTIVVINNAGGGIFQHLPVAQFDPPFEDYFATPQRVDFGQLAAAYGCSHARVDTPAALAEALARPAVPGIHVLEVVTDRRRDAPWRQRMFAELAATLT